MTSRQNKTNVIKSNATSFKSISLHVVVHEIFSYVEYNKEFILLVKRKNNLKKVEVADISDNFGDLMDSNVLAKLFFGYFSRDKFRRPFLLAKHIGVEVLYSLRPKTPISIDFIPNGTLSVSLKMVNPSEDDSDEEDDEEIDHKRAGEVKREMESLLDFSKLPQSLETIRNYRFSRKQGMEHVKKIASVTNIKKIEVGFDFVLLHLKELLEFEQNNMEKYKKMIENQSSDLMELDNYEEPSLFPITSLDIQFPHCLTSFKMLLSALPSLKRLTLQIGRFGLRKKGEDCSFSVEDSEIEEVSLLSEVGASIVSLFEGGIPGNSAIVGSVDLSIMNDSFLSSFNCLPHLRTLEVERTNFSSITIKGYQQLLNGNFSIKNLRIDLDITSVEQNIVDELFKNDGVERIWLRLSKSDDEIVTEATIDLFLQKFIGKFSNLKELMLLSRGNFIMYSFLANDKYPKGNGMMASLLGSLGGDNYPKFLYDDSFLEKLTSLENFQAGVEYFGVLVGGKSTEVKKQPNCWVKNLGNVKSLSLCCRNQSDLVGLVVKHLNNSLEQLFLYGEKNRIKFKKYKELCTKMSEMRILRGDAFGDIHLKFIKRFSKSIERFVFFRGKYQLIWDKNAISRKTVVLPKFFFQKMEASTTLVGNINQIPALAKSVKLWGLVEPYSTSTDWKRYMKNRLKTMTNDEGFSNSDNEKAYRILRDHILNQTKQFLENIEWIAKNQKEGFLKSIKTECIFTFNPRTLEIHTKVYSIVGSGNFLDFTHYIHFRSRMYSCESYSYLQISEKSPLRCFCGSSDEFFGKSVALFRQSLDDEHDCEDRFICQESVLKDVCLILFGKDLLGDDSGRHLQFLKLLMTACGCDSCKNLDELGLEEDEFRFGETQGWVEREAKREWMITDRDDLQEMGYDSNEPSDDRPYDDEDERGGDVGCSIQ